MAKIAVKEVSDQGVKFAFTDGVIVEQILSDLPDSIVRQLALHGLSQKGGDSYSGADSVEEARGLLQKVLENLKNGNWSAARAAGEGGKVTDLARALAEVTGKDLGEVVTKLDEMSKADKMARRKHPAVAAVIARLANERALKKAQEAEKAGSELTTDDLLA